MNAPTIKEITVDFLKLKSTYELQQELPLILLAMLNRLIEIENWMEEVQQRTLEDLK